MNIYIIARNTSKAQDPFHRCFGYTKISRMKGDVELDWISSGHFFFRRKDAKTYISWQTYPDMYEVLTIPFKGRDRRP